MDHSSLLNQYSSHPYSESRSNSFVSLGVIGRGSFSEVHKVRRIIDGKIYALKKIKLNSLKPKQQQYAISQIKILAALASPYIISFRQSFYDPSMQQLCIVMEWANEGDLQNDIERRKKNLHPNNQVSEKNSIITHIQRQAWLIPESEIWRAIRDVLSGLSILHEASILHRDIKTANIFKSQGIYKLGDLNIAKICPGLAYAYTQTGTPYYASPQVWKQLPYNTKSDIWSFGCVIYQMCQLSPPFMGTDMKNLYQIVIRGKYKAISSFYSQQLSHLIDICLKTDPKQRKSSKQILELNWVKNKLHQYCIKEPENAWRPQNQSNGITENLSRLKVDSEKNSSLNPKEISLKLTKQIRDLRSITQPPLQQLCDRNRSNAPNSIRYNSQKLKGVLPEANYPDEIKKSNRSYCYSSCEKARLETKRKQDQLGRPKTSTRRTQNHRCSAKRLDISNEKEKEEYERVKIFIPEQKQCQEIPEEYIQQGSKQKKIQKIAQVKLQDKNKKQKRRVLMMSNKSKASNQKNESYHQDMRVDDKLQQELLQKFKSNSAKIIQSYTNQGKIQKTTQCENKYRYKYKYKYESPIHLIRPSTQNSKIRNQKYHISKYKPSKMCPQSYLSIVKEQPKGVHEFYSDSVRDQYQKNLQQGKRDNSMQSIKSGKSHKINRVLRPISNINNSLHIQSIRPTCTPSYSSRNVMTEQMQIMRQNKKPNIIHESLEDLPKIRKILGNRSNLRQQIGKLYYNYQNRNQYPKASLGIRQYI